MDLVAAKYGTMSPLVCGQFGFGHDPIKYFSVIYAMLEIELENENGQMT